MDIDPVLAVELLAATVYATVPLPAPLLPDVIVSQELLLTAVQVQLIEEHVTAILPEVAEFEYPQNWG